MKPATRRLVYYFAMCFMAQIWPVASLANRIEPRIFGIPFLFFWYMLWIFLIFVGILLLYCLEYGKGDS